MAKQTIKNKDTAEEAAIKTLMAINQKKIDSAQIKLKEAIDKWEAETGCVWVISGRFQGNHVEAGLQVTIKQA